MRYALPLLVLLFTLYGLWAFFLSANIAFQAFFIVLFSIQWTLKQHCNKAKLSNLDYNMTITINQTFCLFKKSKLSQLKNIDYNMLTDLEQRQNKNDSIQSKIIPISKLPPFFPHCIGWEKGRQFQSWSYFWLNGVVLILSWL